MPAEISHAEMAQRVAAATPAVESLLRDKAFEARVVRWQNAAASTSGGNAVPSRTASPDYPSNGAIRTESGALVEIKQQGKSFQIEVVNSGYKTDAQFIARALEESHAPLAQRIRDQVRSRISVKPTVGVGRGTVRAMGPIGMLSQIFGIAADLKEARDPERIRQLADMVRRGELDMNELMLTSFILYNAVREELAKGVMA